MAVDRRKASVWTPNVGWVKKSTTTERDYSEYSESDSWAFLISFWRWYPDIMLDMFRSKNAKYSLELIQRVILRAFARYQFVTITGCRSLTKTTCNMDSMAVSGILWPEKKTSYYGPSYKQQAELAKVAFHDFQEDYPLLAKHYMIDAEAKDVWGISTKYGSTVTINAIRGKNVHDVTAEEFAQEEAPPFDHDEFKTVVLYAVRLVHMVQGKKDPTYIPYQQRAITSAGRKQNPSFTTRCNHLTAMRRGQSAFVMDVPWQVIVLSQMRTYTWAMQRKQESTVEKWMREMESRYTGTDENPIVRDEVLTDCRQILLMEEHSCCKDRDNKLLPEDVIYVIGYDVSYEDSKNNAKCACVVVKLTKQKEWLKRDHYLKQVVWVDDWPPPNSPMAQAKMLKSVWHRYCYPGSQAYIAIDSWQYGKSVVQALMADLHDELAPLCIYNHESETEYELEDAEPVIYPIKAGGIGTTDPDSEMIRNAELQFENRNVLLLTASRTDGIEAFRRYHRIKDQLTDSQIDRPYRKTAELVGQIQNLKKIPTGSGCAEKRISKAIQRDSWSALKYALRFAQKLERINLVKEKRKSEWDEMIKEYADHGIEVIGVPTENSGRMVAPRIGGRRV